MPHNGSQAWRQAGGPCAEAADPGKNKASPHESQPARIHPGATVLRITPRAPSPPAAILHLAHQAAGEFAAAFVVGSPACCQASDAAG